MLLKQPKDADSHSVTRTPSRTFIWSTHGLPTDFRGTGLWRDGGGMVTSVKTRSGTTRADKL